MIKFMKLVEGIMNRQLNDIVKDLTPNEKKKLFDVILAPPKETIKITTYRQMNKSMDCSVCGKSLVESDAQDIVRCIAPECEFNEL